MVRGTRMVLLVPISGCVPRIFLRRHPRTEPDGREQSEAEQGGNGSQPIPAGREVEESVSHKFSFT
jgi:hypothetical protein